jgi:hypothetical protein
MRRTTGTVAVAVGVSVCVGVGVSVGDGVAVGDGVTGVSVGDGVAVGDGVTGVSVGVGEGGVGAYVNGYAKLTCLPSQLDAVILIRASPGWRSPSARPTAR